VIQGTANSKESRLLLSFIVLIKQFYPELRTVLFGLKPIPDVLMAPSKGVEKRSLPPVRFPDESLSILGRIALLKEAAGKIRQIAIIDPFTQWLLKPIHDYMFSILTKIPQDGTFDQSKPALDLMEKIRKLGGKTFVSSLDMTDATNRLVATLQRDLLVPFLGTVTSHA